MLTVLHGDSLEKLRELPERSVHTCVTSPPYWGLRDYGIAPSVWLPSPSHDDCRGEHEWAEHVQPAANGIQHAGGMSGETLSGNSATRKPKLSAFCAKCGAWRGCFGLEPTPELYVAHAVLIFREVRRVLRDDGTLWVNLGDSYNSAASGQNGMSGTLQGGKPCGGQGTTAGRRPLCASRKPGDLVGIPWLVAFALQADGWFLRRDNIWFKPNPMPESVNGWRWERHRVKSGRREATQYKPSGWNTANGSHAETPNGRYEDRQHEALMVNCPGCAKCAPNGGLVLRKGSWRCTTSHEYVFQFSKRAQYFCDAEAAKEKASCDRMRGPALHRSSDTNGNGGLCRRPLDGGRNLRSVWRITTKPYREAHFATFPPDLVRPIIRAASPVQCCARCGAPWAPVLERGVPDLEHQRACGGDVNGHYAGEAQKDYRTAGAQDASAVKARILAGMIEKRVTGHRPTCGCGAPGVPAKVLDIFAGSGTTGQVALEEGRDAILIELNAEYLLLIQQRCTVTPGLALR